MNNSEENISGYLYSFFRKNLAYTLSFVFERSVLFLLLPFYTRLFTQSEYGIYSLFIATVSVGTFIYSLGIENSLIKFKSEKHDIKLLDGTILNGMLIPAFLFTVILFIAPSVFSNLIFGTGNYEILIYLIGISLFLETIIRFFTFSVIGEQKSKVFLLVSVLKGILTIGLNFILVYYLELKLMGAVYSFVITSLLIALALFLMKKIKLSFEFDKSLFKKLFKYSYPVMLTSVFLMLLNFADTYIFRFFYDSEKVGIYSASYKLGIGMNMLVTAFATAVIPFSLKLLDENSENKKILNIVVQIFIPILLIVFLIFSLFYIEVLQIQLFGFYLIDPKFHGASGIIPLILLSYVFAGLYSNATVPFYSKSETKKLAVITLIAMFINLILNVILTPKFGYWGAAISTLLSFIVLAGLTIFYAQKIVKINYAFIKLFLFLIIAVGFYVFSEVYFVNEILVKVIMCLTFIGAVLFNSKKIIK